jgi:hypothetical protein
MAEALRGNLRDFGIGEVFQLIGQQRKTGVLEVAGETERIRLAFDGGAVVAAAPVGSHEHAALGEMLVRIGRITRERLLALDREREESLQSLPQLLIQQEDLEIDAREIREVQDLLDRETIFQLLRWREGSFHFTSQPVTHDREPSDRLGAEQILMDGLRMVDEWRTFTDRVPSEDTVFQRAGRFETYRNRFVEEPAHLRDAEHLFMLVNGRLTVRRIIDLARLGTFEGTRLLAELRGAGLIEPVDPSQVARTRRSRRQPIVPDSPFRYALAAALPVLLLAALAYVPRLQLASPVDAEAVQLHEDPIEYAHVAYRTQRLRNAIDAHRFAFGRWPHSLQELVDRKWLEPSALTAGSGHPYYYVRRGDGYVVLAPEP